MAPSEPGAKIEDAAKRLRVDMGDVSGQSALRDGEKRVAQYMATRPAMHLDLMAPFRLLSSRED